MEDYKTYTGVCENSKTCEVTEDQWLVKVSLPCGYTGRAICLSCLSGYLEDLHEVKRTFTKEIYEDATIGAFTLDTVKSQIRINSSTN